MSSIERAIARLTATTGSFLSQSTATSLNLKQGGLEQPPVPKSKPHRELNFAALAQAGYLTPDTTQGILAEEYRLLKRPLLRDASDQAVTPLPFGNLIAITSALPGEGKTYTSFNLAMSIAMEWDTTVLLIDCDLIKHSLTHLVGLDDATGLTDVLLDPLIDLGDVIVQTNVPKFRLIPAGRPSRNATELLSSEQMHKVVSELSARYDDRIVLFDTPPLLLNSQSLALTALTGQILMVVAEGKTPQKDIMEAIALLDEKKAIGMVLNKCHRWLSSKYDKYNYAA